MRGSVERVCTGYSLPLYTQASSYRGQLNGVITDAKACEEFLGCYRVRPAEGSQILPVGDDDCDEQRGDSIPPPHDAGYIVEDPPRPSLRILSYFPIF